LFYETQSFKLKVFLQLQVSLVTQFFVLDLVL
jgi:hypothetical protein